MIDSGGSINNRHGTWISELQLLDTTDQLRFLPNVSHACETLTDCHIVLERKETILFLQVSKIS